MKKYNHKIFLDNAWALDFFAPRVKKYWPGTKEIVSLKIELVKVFLDYLRFTLRYSIFIKNNRGKIEEKKVIVKVERPKNFNWPPRLGRVYKDFTATRFLVDRGLKKFLPRPLEFYAPLQAYLYEEAEGVTLKNFIRSENWQINKFYKSIPAIIRALKKVHGVKIKPVYAKGNYKKDIEDGIRQWLDIINKYYPAGSVRALEIVKSLEAIKKKYKNILFNRSNYSIIHGDFQNDNIIIGERGKISFIDLADSKFFNPLDDLASFLIQSEMHFKYVRPKNYAALTEKLKKIVYASYFGKKAKLQDELQIEFFSAKDILRIITFISFTQRAWQTVNDHSKTMDDLLSFAESRIKNIYKRFL
ncbi:MAG: phosphotransferase [Patescibacteria group bacterium]|jgi:thiamine kinase-like enzyme